MSAGGLRSYVLGAGAGVIGRAVEAVSGFAALWLLTQMLSAEQYGLLAITNRVLELAVLLAARGFEQIVLFRASGLREVGRGSESVDLSSANLAWAIVLSASAAGALALASGAVAGWFDAPELAFWLVCMAVMIPLRSALVVYGAWLRTRDRVAEALLVGRSLPSALTVLLLAAFWFGSASAVTIACAYALPVLGVVLYWWLRNPVAPRLRGGRRVVADLGYGAKVALTSLAHRSVWGIDVLMLGLLASSVVAGQYNIAVRVALLAMLAHEVLETVLAPRMRHFVREGRTPELRDEYERTRVLAWLAGLVVAIVCAVFGAPLLGLLGDNETAHPVLLLLCAAYLCHASFGSNGALLNMLGRAGWTLVATLVALAVDLVLNALWIPTLGGLGAALATLATLVVMNSLIAGILLRLDGIATLTPTDLAALTAATAGLGLAAFGHLSTGRLTAVLVGLLVCEAARTARSWRPSLERLARLEFTPREVG